MKKTRFALFQSVISLMLCVSMLVGTTFAWFTDTVNTGINTIAAGVLDVELYHTNATAADEPVTQNTELFKDLNGKPILWEPGAVSYENLRITNAGDLALVYRMTMVTANENFVKDPDGSLNGLSKALKVGIVPGGVTATDRQGVIASVEGGWISMSEFLRSGTLLPEGKGVSEETWGVVIYWEPGEYDNLWNLNNGKELTDGDVLSIDLGISLIATQEEFESDSFGTDYDVDAKGGLFPDFESGTVTAPVQPDVNGLTAEDVSLTAEQVAAFVPKGVKLASGANQLALTVKEMSDTGSDVQLGENEAMRSLDVHIDGVAADNTQPITVTLKEAVATGLNMGNYKLYHVENGVTAEMTYVEASADFTAHNQFKYDPATGDVTLYMATFSEVALVADTENAWEGNFDYSWYTNAVASADGESATVYTIANADQLAGFGAIVGGMAEGIDQDSFSGKTVKLLADINLGDAEEENNSDLIFYPIGYNSSDGKYEKTGVAVTTGFYNFCGTFDGNGHTISNFYQNTWEMKGDNNYYDATLQYFRDGMGLFGRVYGATIKNLTVKNFSSDGEYTTTGVIAAYADFGATFENIAIFNCNPRVYNIGNGGIVGCVGWYTKGETDQPVTFKNITVDNSNKISALWGSWDVACGGIVGQYYPTSGQSSANYPENAGVHFENCHVAAQIDVYNDVCANYQYYAYRYSGMLIGSVRENETIDGHSYPKMDKITANNCTVHFGDWNDYYYCELVANTLASYTHDHQMSRLEQVASVDVKNMKVTSLDGKTTDIPKTGRYNYVVVKAKDDKGMWIHGDGHDYAECYHIVDGTQHKHDFADKDNPDIYEIVDGEEVLKEDKQLVYREFNNLVTGYGWGVTSKGVDDLNGVDILDKKLDGSSVQKFVKSESAKSEYTSTSIVYIGDLFQAVENAVLDIKKEAIQVSVSPVGDGSTAGGTYVANTTDWTKGTLTFSGVGAATITITDYYFCTPTTITVEVTECQPAEKFDIVMNNGNFLHRVGNVGTVALDKLFKAKDGVTVGTVSVAIEAVNGTSASGTYSNNAIQFNGTGVVKVTIKDDDKYCTPTELYLEVVNATNVTTATSATDKNIVLLNDLTASSLEVSNGWTFHGNGFKIAFSGDGSYRSAALSYGFVTVKDGGVLDNAQIICKVFPKSYLYTNEMSVGSDGRYPYGYSAVVTIGNATISNSYIYGARNNIQIGEGNVTIDNTILECGSLANIHIKSNSSYTVTLNDVTTIQYPTTDDFGQNATVMGFGVLVGTNESESNPTILLTGDMKQYNWVNGDMKVSNTYAQTAITEALEQSAYQHTIGGKTTINMGIVFLNTKTATITDTDSRANKKDIPYQLNNITMSTYKGQVYSITKGNITADARFDPVTDGLVSTEKKSLYKPTETIVIVPTASLNGNANAAVKVESVFDNGWQEVLSIDLDNISGGSYTFAWKDLIVSKYDANLAFEIKDSSGNTVDKNGTITLNALSTTSYTLKVIDTQVFGADGSKLSNVEHEIPFVIKSTKTSIEPPKFANDGTATAIRLVDKAGGDWRPAYTVLTGVTVTYWSASESKVKTVDLSTLYNDGKISSNVWTYTCDDFTLTITGGQVHSDGTKITPVVSNSTLYFASTNKAFGTGTTSRNIVLTYVFTDKNDSTTWNRTETVTYSNLSEYDYSKFKNGKLEAPSSGSNPCVTPDTLVTLADGTQKRIDQVSYTDQLLVWDFYSGEYAYVPAVFIQNHGFDMNNVIKLTFSDGTVTKAVNEHGYFDATLNEFVMINPESASEFIGHEFVQEYGKSYRTVTLLSAEITKEYVEAYSILSAYYCNFITDRMFSLTSPTIEINLFMPFEVGEDMKFDEDKMEEDIARYGLYEYADVAGEIPLEVFEVLNIKYLKIFVGKGMITIDQAVELLTVLNS